jgi:hypothetical protein
VSVLDVTSAASGKYSLDVLVGRALTVAHVQVVQLGSIALVDLHARVQNARQDSTALYHHVLIAHLVNTPQLQGLLHVMHALLVCIPLP